MNDIKRSDFTGFEFNIKSFRNGFLEFILYTFEFVFCKGWFIGWAITKRDGAKVIWIKAFDFGWVAKLFGIL